MKWLFLVILFTSPAFASSEQEALVKSTEAWLKHTGADKRIEEMIKDKIPKEYENTVNNLGIAASVIHNKRIEIKWDW